uniref:JNK/Rab-associated protein-1 N-terminal domain-containing protein n=1 Tax=Panagrolaimus sp. JU765 TaxID=591449 RepID=A0AC34QEC6_9BILA
MSSWSISSPSGSPSRLLSKDIIDVCEPIKEQLKAMKNLYGEESIIYLTPPVVAALEELERFKILYDEEHQKCLEFEASVEKLEKNLKQKHDENQRLKEDIAVVEAANQDELASVSRIVDALKKENKKLKEKVATAESFNESFQIDSAPSASDEEAQAMLDLRKRYLKEHEQVRELNEQIAIEKDKIEELRGNIEKLYGQNKELLRKNKSLVAQGKILITERAELSRKYDQMSQEYIRTKNALESANLTCQDLEFGTLGSRSESDIPKFTEKELQDVFMSKVKLIERITELEMQLERLKSSSPAESEKTEENFSRPSSTASVISHKSTNNEECLVYGPINKEPDEKLYPGRYEKRESGVRKFFSSLFKNVNNSPRRGSNATGY